MFANDIFGSNRQEKEAFCIFSVEKFEYKRETKKNQPKQEKKTKDSKIIFFIIPIFNFHITFTMLFI